jgi:hypothetical protein
MRFLSVYEDEETKRKARVFIDNGQYFVELTTDTGTTFKANFPNEQSAEIYAEDWVMNK